MKKKRHPEREEAPVKDAAPAEPATEQASVQSPSPPPPETALSPEEIEELRSRAVERDQFHEKFLRARADLENYRKRASREMEDRSRYAIVPFAREILEVRDDLLRTLAAVDAADGDLGALMEGVRLVRDQLDKALALFHIKPVPAQGQPFDPNFHEAVSLQMTDQFPDHTVIEEVQTGFTLHDRLVRPAKVIVSRALPEEDEEASEPEADA